MRYDYQCQTCNEIFEVQHGMNETPAVACPMCDSGDVKKIILASPHIAIAWKVAYGMGHSGQIALPSARNKRLLEQNQKRRRASRRKNEAKVQP